MVRKNTLVWTLNLCHNKPKERSKNWQTEERRPRKTLASH